MIKIKSIIVCLLLVSGLSAQDLSKLTPQQLEAYKKYAAGNTAITGSAVKEVENRTLTTVGDNKQDEKDNYTKDNYTKDKDNSDNDFDDSNEMSLTKDKKDVKTQEVKATVFGSHLFTTQNLTFEPKLNIPTPTNYILGTYDELLIDISGLYEANYKLKVSPEGTIRIPNVGPIKVSGMAIDNATRTIRSQVSKIYMGVSSGETKVDVTLGNIRSIRVTIVGEAVRPGTYTLPSLATAFNAIYACGGPSILGSMRDIKVIRNGKVVSSIDVYRFLLDGVLVNNIALQDEDVIKIESYKVRATINGAVKHTGIFEALPGETLQNLIRFAGGFTDNAYKDKITTIRLTKTEKTVVDVTEKQTSTFQLQSGDEFLVSTTLNKFDNRVDIRGAIFRPGAYALEAGLTVKQLIAKADGLKEDAYLNMAHISRKKVNQIPEIIGFNLGELVRGTAPDILLQKNDSVIISSLFDYREEQSVSIWGAVKSPGTFKLVENTTLKDLIFKAHGFTEMASTDSVELVRVIKDQQTLLTTDQRTIVKKFALDKDLNILKGTGDILLENGDQVIVRSISGYEGVRMVKVDGEVLKPGSYNITNKAERVSDLIRRCGGFTKYAYPMGAFLIRTEKVSPIEAKLKGIMAENAKKSLKSENDNSIDIKSMQAPGLGVPLNIQEMDSIQNNKSVSKAVKELYNPEGIVGIDLISIMKNPGGKHDINLEEGDVIFIPRELQTIRVIGEVLFPTYVRYSEGTSFKEFINNAGGYTEQANKNKAFVLYANGSAKGTKKFLGLKFYPQVKPGSRIVVPEKPTQIKNKMSVLESLSMLTSLTSALALIYSVVK